jgi:putative intracellular protease/amidase
VRWLYHIARRGEQITAKDGFVHASFAGAVRESAAVHFAGIDPAMLAVSAIDPRRLDARVEIANTKRGPMPHIHGAVPRDAVRATIALEAFGQDADAALDRVTGTRFMLVAFEGMTLLDLVGVYDPLSRIQTMQFDAESRVEIASARGEVPWSDGGARMICARVRPDLSDVDVLVIAGGMGTRALAEDRAIVEWIASFPANRLAASVCTGAMLLGAAGRLRGKIATTHHTMRHVLAEYGATASEERVVDQGQVITAGGVTSGIDLGLHLVRRLEGEEIARKIAVQMEVTRPFAL